MTDWCKQTFKKNGLLNRIKQSESSEKEVEQKVRFHFIGKMESVALLGSELLEEAHQTWRMPNCG